MKSRPKTYIRAAGMILAMFAVLVAVRPGSAQVAPQPAATSGLSVTVADLTSAGFTGIKLHPASTGSYLPPNTYFNVDETVAKDHPEWGGAANVVAVLIIPMRSDWSYGTPQVSDIDGRTQVRASRAGYYIVVTGPDKTKVQALSQLLISK